jgi:Spy/CpxP family protein refolding chaperone
MSRKPVFLCAVLLTVCVVTFAQAQEQGGRRERRPPRMGMMRPGGMFGGQGMNLMLLNNEKVQKELEITAEQKEKIDALAREVREKMPDFRGLRDLTPEEREKKMEENRKKMEKVMEDVQAKLKETLLPNQLERVNQIRIQAAGTMALMDPEVVKELGITEEQKTKMNSLREEMMGKFRDARGDREKMQELRKESDEALMNVLTAEQKGKLKKMKGEKFDVESLRLFGPPNRGPNRGGRNRPAPPN